MSESANEEEKGPGTYIPREFRQGEPEVPDTYEEGPLQIFGLGPSRLDLEQSRAAKTVKKYVPVQEKLRNAVVIAARTLYLEDREINADNILSEWDYSATPPPDKSFIESYIKTAEFKLKKDSIGVQVPEERHEGLNATQIALITTLTQPDGKPLHLKLKKHKISWVTFQGWIKNPKFLRSLELSAEQALGASKAFSIIQLVQQSAAGQMNAIDRVLAMTGRWDPNNRKQVDAQRMVSIILQVLDEEITDPELKDRIGARLSLLSNAAAAESSSTIQGELDS